MLSVPSIEFILTSAGNYHWVIVVTVTLPFSSMITHNSSSFISLNNVPKSSKFSLNSVWLLKSFWMSLLFSHTVTMLLSTSMGCFKIIAKQIVSHKKKLYQMCPCKMEFQSRATGLLGQWCRQCF